MHFFHSKMLKDKDKFLNEISIKKPFFHFKPYFFLKLGKINFQSLFNDL